MKLVLPIYCLLFCLCSVSAGEPDAREIMEKERARHSLNDEDRMLEMELIDRRGKVKKRKVHMMNMTTKENMERLMLVFLEPRDVEGTGVLTWEQDKREDDQWLYLPSTKKEKRIAGGGKKNSFMGTDFAYEDLSIEKLDLHKYTYLESKPLNGKECYLIEAELVDDKDKKNSGYSKRVLWVRKDLHFTMHIDYYDKKGKLVKTLDNSEPEQVDGDVWRSEVITMKNLKRDHQTKMIVLERKFNQDLDESNFTIRKLKSY